MFIQYKDVSYKENP